MASRRRLDRSVNLNHSEAVGGARLIVFTNLCAGRDSTWWPNFIAENGGLQ